MPRIATALGLGFVLSGLGVACSSSGPDICARLPDIENAAISKFSPCNDGGISLPIVIPPTATCEARLATCSSADQSKLSSFADCVEGLPTCMPGQEDTWELEGALCLAGLQGVSSSCTGFDGGL